MMRVLIVEDNPSVARFLEGAARENGYETLVVTDGLAALRAVQETYDLILLDVMLPGIDGFTVCRRLRSAGIGTPVLMLTARDTLEDKVAGLDSGADDYIVKPFALAELLARMRALLRRHTGSPTGILSVADLRLDTASRQVTRAGRTVSLSTTEFSLLEYLMRNQGRVLTRGQILDHVWHYDFGGNDNVLDVYISYLRSKIDRGQSFPLIHTVRSVGYRLAGPSEEADGTG